MILRKLEQREHQETRALWEEVFAEDTKAFLDYYYYIKARDNEIYVVEETDQICSMLHLNPYILKIEDTMVQSAYIVAVATKKMFRGRGFMGSLLRKALDDMYRKKIPFTFLMPAAEAIYLPYDFRYIYDQNMGSIDCRHVRESMCTGKDDCIFSDALLWDAEELSRFYEKYILPAWQICSVRDTAYYQTLIMEQQSEHGGIRIIRSQGDIKGFYAYADEEKPEIREPFYLPGYAAAYMRSVRELFEKRVSSRCMDNCEKDAEIDVYACKQDECIRKKPAIMGRIVRVDEFLKILTVPLGCEVNCSFAVIDPIVSGNSRVWRITSCVNETELHVRETEDSEGVFPVSILTEYLFGRLSNSEICGLEGVIATEHLLHEMGKINKITKVFLNEIV